jgi:riboflavin synthase
VTDIGTIRKVTTAGDTRFDITTAYAPDSIEIGASIACSGVCLTVIEKGTDASTDTSTDESHHWFSVEASAETLNVTTAGDWQTGTTLNLERALRLGDELGGHIVSGHVDGIAEIVDIQPEGDSLRFTFRAPAELAKFIAPKGSVTLDGTSLTVNEVTHDKFGVNFIPHTQSVTTWGQSAVGDKVNLEIDVLARYVARLNEANGESTV